MERQKPVLMVKEFLVWRADAATTNAPFLKDCLSIRLSII